MDHLIQPVVLLVQANVLVKQDMVGLNATLVMSTTIQVLEYVLVSNKVSFPRENTTFSIFK